MRVLARRDPEGKPQDLPERQDHERLKDGLGRRFPFGLPLPPCCYQLATHTRNAAESENLRLQGENPIRM